MGEGSQRPGGILLVGSSCPALLFPCDLVPTLPWSVIAVVLARAPSSDSQFQASHLLSFQLIPSTTPIPVYLWAPAGSEIHWLYFLWSLTLLTLSLSLYLVNVLWSIIVISPLGIYPCPSLPVSYSPGKTPILFHPVISLFSVLVPGKAIVAGDADIPTTLPRSRTSRGHFTMPRGPATFS